MLVNRIQQVRRSPVVQEKQSLTDTPQRSGSKFVSSRYPLINPVRQVAAHVMQRKIREWVIPDITHSRVKRLRSN